MMKTKYCSLLFVVTTLTIFLFSCHDEQIPPSISGNWTLVELNGSGTMSAEDKQHIKPDSFIYSYTYTGKDFDAVLKLEKEPDVFSESGQYKETRTIDSMGTIITENVTHILGGNGEWYVEEDSLFFLNFISPIKNEILMLTVSTLKLKENIDYYQYDGNHMFPQHFEGTEIRTYERNQ